VIPQDPTHPGQVLKALSELVLDPTVGRIRIAVSYANLKGVEALETLLSAVGRPIDVEVVLSLDMGITRKAALQETLREFGEHARVISGAGAAGTFHAKVFVVDRDGGPLRALIGSANLTHAALTNNREVISVADLDADETAAWEAWWDDLVDRSDPLTQQIIDGYVERRPPPGCRERIADEDVETRDDGLSVTHDPAEIDAEDAEWLVIDWGGTGEYRVQAEFPKAPAAFFRPELDHQRSITIEHGGHEYVDNLLRYYPDNGMVRINLDAEIPFVADESVKEGTSLFTRVDDDRYELSLVEEAERARRLAEAVAGGHRDFTQRHNGTHREFGWK